MSVDSTQAWLGELERLLADMPKAQRIDIVEETRAHLQGRLAAGLTPAQALHGFGSATDYARAFVDNFTVTRALESRSTMGMVQVLVHTVGRSFRSLLALLAISACTVLAGAVLVTTIVQATSATPGRIEYVVVNVPADSLHPAQHTVSFGASAAGDVLVLDLGGWFFPLAALAFAALWYVGRFGLLMAVKSLRR